MAYLAHLQVQHNGFPVTETELAITEVENLIYSTIHLDIKEVTTRCVADLRGPTLTHLCQKLYLLPLL